MAKAPTLVDLTALVDEYVTAYNDSDFATLEKLIAEDIHLIHRNRGVDITARAGVLESFRQFGELLPDRAYHDRRAVDQIDDHTVVVRHSWAGTASVDIPGFGSAGERVGFDLASFLTFRDGQIVEWEDYG
ncbi:hypothetical protein Rruber_05210 (plasmid) [Rhodococcus ruber]|uniref:nuclear transport factor 2 family protein n=1 Tax=Rhodococcus ruber TaxID=1830 RepID=UPI00315CB6E0